MLLHKKSQTRQIQLQDTKQQAQGSVLKKQTEVNSEESRETEKKWETFLNIYNFSIKSHESTFGRRKNWKRIVSKESVRAKKESDAAWIKWREAT